MARTLPIDAAAARIRIVEGNRATRHARHWLRLIGGGGELGGEQAEIVILAGDAPAPEGSRARCVIRLWDFQVGYSGSGVEACAATGVAAVIGPVDGPGHPLPVEIPEKWCGAFGVILALAEVWRAGGMDQPIRHEISSADILRAFSLQNAGTREELERGWRPNGRICYRHGGIFPMGFFACRDGHVALLGRSRRDWRNIRTAIGDPEWACDPAFEDPFKLARDSAVADRLLEQTLSGSTRDELLARGLAAEAVIAPVYSHDEAAARGVFRDHFLTEAGPAMPFVAAPIDGRAKARSEGRASGEPVATQPLAGLRVVELCWVWSGPLVCQILADLGAEVIKIEAPKRFDLYRTRGLEARRGEMPEPVRIESSYQFHSLNRNKTGFTVDLKSPDGLALVRDLIGRSDILVDNFTVGTLERLGLGAEELANLNPSLVQMSMSGPGRGSSVEALRSYGLVLSALGGAEGLICDADGAFLGSPLFSISDPNAATFGVLTALGATLAARENGAGWAIDLSQIEAAATLSATPPVGEAVPLPDELVGLAETDDSEIFADCPGWVESVHPVTGAERLVASPWRTNGARAPARRPAPMLGGDDDEVLSRLLGLPTARIAALKAEGVVGVPASDGQS